MLIWPPAPAVSTQTQTTPRRGVRARAREVGFLDPWMLINDHLVAVKIDAVETFDGFMPCVCLLA